MGLIPAQGYRDAAARPSRLVPDNADYRAPEGGGGVSERNPALPKRNVPFR